MKVRATYRYARPCLVAADPVVFGRVTEVPAPDDPAAKTTGGRGTTVQVLGFMFYKTSLSCQQNRSHIVTTESIEYSSHGFSQKRNRVPVSFSHIRFDPLQLLAAELRSRSGICIIQPGRYSHHEGQIQIDLGYRFLRVISLSHSKFLPLAHA